MHSMLDKRCGVQPPSNQNSMDIFPDISLEELAASFVTELDMTVASIVSEADSFTHPEKPDPRLTQQDSGTGSGTRRPNDDKLEEILASLFSDSEEDSRDSGHGYGSGDDTVDRAEDRQFQRLGQDSQSQRLGQDSLTAEERARRAQEELLANIAQAKSGSKNSTPGSLSIYGDHISVRGRSVYVDGIKLDLEGVDTLTITKSSGEIVTATRTTTGGFRIGGSTVMVRGSECHVQ